jgi:magnesium chelatase family protein
MHARDGGGVVEVGKRARDAQHAGIAAGGEPHRFGRLAQELEARGVGLRHLFERCAADYQGRLSGPLIDRIDLIIEVPAVTAADVILPPPAEGSLEVGARVARAREIQVTRYAGLDGVSRTNAAVPGSALEEVAKPDAAGLKLLLEAADAMRLSARGYTRVLRVARTLADLDGAATVSRVHLAEAISYRTLIDEVRKAAVA